MGFVERGDLTEEQLDAALDVESMTHPDPGRGSARTAWRCTSRSEVLPRCRAR